MARLMTVVVVVIIIIIVVVVLVDVDVVVVDTIGLLLLCISAKENCKLHFHVKNTLISH